MSRSSALIGPAVSRVVCDHSSLVAQAPWIEFPVTATTPTPYRIPVLVRASAAEALLPVFADLL